MKRLKVRGSTLQTSLFVSVVIALILSSLVLYLHIFSRFQIDSQELVETVKNNHLGIEHFLAESTFSNDTIENISDNNRTLKLHSNFWGVFEKVSSITSIKTKKFKKIALVGGYKSFPERPALYLKDNNKPLVVVGNTKIEGTAYLSKLGVKPGTISGKSYYGKQLIYGVIKDALNLPSFNASLLNSLKQMMLVEPNNIITIEPNRNYANSFFDKTQYIFKATTINLNNIKLVGNIIVRSNTKIIIESSAVLQDIILVAPEIEVRNNVKGYFQVFATKSISVGKNCDLQYPSSLIVQGKKKISQDSLKTNKPSNNQITVDRFSSVKGVVAYFGNDTKVNTTSQIQIEDGASITGEVYCDQNIELKGSVNGSVFTSNFLAHQSGSIYQNHIYNGQIIAKELSSEYKGILFTNSKRGIVKWLY